MAITTDWTTHVKGPLPADACEMEVTTGLTDLCDQLAAPSHVFLQVYTAGASEIILADACDGAKVHITRGMDGTKSRTWDDGACVCVVRIVDGAVPGAGWETEPFCDCPDPWDQLQAQGGITFDKSNPDSPVLSLTPTGVAAGNYGGATVNTTGQFTFIPPGWPASALPVFDPCTCAGQGGGGGQQVQAADVTFTPQGAPGIITSTNVQGALYQAEDAIAALQIQGTGVQSITPGTGLNNTGTNANPVLNLTNTGIAAGTYAGFTVDAQGRITAYTPVAADDVKVTVNAPLTVAYDGATKTYDLDIEDATTTERGVVQLVSAGAILGQTTTPADNGKVVTLEGAENLINVKAKTINANTALAGGGQLIADVDLDVDFGEQPATTAPTQAAEFLIFDQGLNPDHQRVNSDTASNIVRGAHALLQYDGAADSVVASLNVNSVIKNATADYTVDMVAAGSTTYVVLPFAVGTTAETFTVEITSQTQFRIKVVSGNDATFMLAVFRLL